VKGPKQQGKELAVRGAACNRQTTPSANMRTNCLDNRRCRLRSNCQIYLHVEWNTFRSCKISFHHVQTVLHPDTFISVPQTRYVYCNISPVMCHIRKFDLESQVAIAIVESKLPRIFQTGFVGDRINRAALLASLLNLVCIVVVDRPAF